MTAPVLVIGWGNPSRGDDAMGPLLVEQLQAVHADAAVDWLIDFQLQVEHALDLVGREHVLFVDASQRGAAPFEVSGVEPRRDASYTSHALSPAAVLHAHRELQGGAAPTCTLLAIRGERFELGAPLSDAGARHLAQAVHWAREWLTHAGSATPG
jgi:hydrogenase maturation protease